MWIFTKKKKNFEKIYYSAICVTLCLFCSPRATSFYPHLFGRSLCHFNYRFDGFPFFGSFQTNVYLGLALRSCNETPWDNIYWRTGCITPIFFFFFFLHFSSSSSYLYLFHSWASSACFFHGSVNIFFVLFKNISISGRNGVWAIWSGNFKLVCKSDLSSQTVASDSALVCCLPLVWILLQPWQTLSNFSGYLVY